MELVFSRKTCASFLWPLVAGDSAALLHLPELLLVMDGASRGTARRR